MNMTRYVRGYRFLCNTSSDIIHILVLKIIIAIPTLCEKKINHVCNIKHSSKHLTFFAVKLKVVSQIRI